MLHKQSQNLKTTTHSRTYKMYQRAQVLGCPICGPNSGCNRYSKYKDRNWKKYRKTQYKQK
jgi:hypothetical protein